MCARMGGTQSQCCEVSVKRERAWEAHRWGPVRSRRPCRSCAKPLLCAGQVLGVARSHEPFETVAHAEGCVRDSRLVRRLEPSSADVVVRVSVAERLQQDEVGNDLRWQLRLCVCRLQLIGLRRRLLAAVLWAAQELDECLADVPTCAQARG